MISEAQVKVSHYDFESYMYKGRWVSIWHQLDEILRDSRPKRVLEIGGGIGLLKKVAAVYNVSIETVDIDPELNPDHVASVIELPFDDKSYDVCCAFQVLEHLPFEQSLKAFGELVRVAKHRVILSLPDAKKVWRYKFHIPKLASLDLLIPVPRISSQLHKFDGQHYWEIGTKGFSVREVCSAFQSVSSVSIKKNYRVKENPYHRFMVFEHRGRET